MSSEQAKDRQPPASAAPQGENTEITQIQVASFHGPLPHPSLLARYNEVIPGGADRIMAMAERQSAHREALEAQMIAANLASQTRGSIFAFLLCLVTILGGMFLIYSGKSGVGLASVIASLAGLASVFFVARREQRKERTEKGDALNSRKR